MNKQKINIATVAYGEKYIGYCHKKMLPSIQYDVEFLENERYDISFNIYSDFLNMIRMETRHSIQSGSYTFFSPADIIWARGSLYNLVHQIEFLNCCIAVPHFRVEDDFDVEIPLSASDLASKALLKAHPTFSYSHDHLRFNECHWGFSVRQLNDNIITIRHNMPNVVMVKFEQSDCDFFLNHEKPLNQWDRGWLDKLSSEDRLKIVGSSDIAFGVELTKKGKGNPVKENNYDERHCIERPSNALCRSTIYSLRLS